SESVGAPLDFPPNVFLVGTDPLQTTVNVGYFQASAAWAAHTPTNAQDIARGGFININTSGLVADFNAIGVLAAALTFHNCRMGALILTAGTTRGNLKVAITNCRMDGGPTLHGGDLYSEGNRYQSDVLMDALPYNGTGGTAGMGYLKVLSIGDAFMRDLTVTETVVGSVE